MQYQPKNLFRGNQLAFALVDAAIKNGNSQLANMVVSAARKVK